MIYSVSEYTLYGYFSFVLPDTGVIRKNGVFPSLSSLREKEKVRKWSRESLPFTQAREWSHPRPLSSRSMEKLEGQFSQYISVGS